MEGLFTFHYPGKIYPVNRQSSTVFGIHAYPDVKSIPDSVELAVLTIPEASVEQVVQDCCEKRVKGITIVTAGFGETMEGGRQREEAIAKLAQAHGVRIIGPNVSGTSNVHAGFNASPLQQILATSLAGISQGGYAFGDLLASGYGRRMGLGKFIHTGNECDLQVTDFLAFIFICESTLKCYRKYDGFRAGKKFYFMRIRDHHFYLGPSPLNRLTAIQFPSESTQNVAFTYNSTSVTYDFVFCYLGTRELG